MATNKEILELLIDLRGNSDVGKITTDLNRLSTILVELDKVFEGKGFAKFGEELATAVKKTGNNLIELKTFATDVSKSLSDFGLTETLFNSLTAFEKLEVVLKRINSLNVGNSIVTGLDRIREKVESFGVSDTTKVRVLNNLQKFMEEDFAKLEGTALKGKSALDYVFSQLLSGLKLGNAKNLEKGISDSLEELKNTIIKGTKNLEDLPASDVLGAVRKSLTTGTKQIVTLATEDVAFIKKTLVSLIADVLDEKVVPDKTILSGLGKALQEYPKQLKPIIEDVKKAIIDSISQLDFGPNGFKLPANAKTLLTDLFAGLNVGAVADKNILGKAIDEILKSAQEAIQSSGGVTLQEIKNFNEKIITTLGLIEKDGVGNKYKKVFSDVDDGFLTLTKSVAIDEGVKNQLANLITFPVASIEGVTAYSQAISDLRKRVLELADTQGVSETSRALYLNLHELLGTFESFARFPIAKGLETTLSGWQSNATAALSTITSIEEQQAKLNTYLEQQIKAGLDANRVELVNKELLTQKEALLTRVVGLLSKQESAQRDLSTISVLGGGQINTTVIEATSSAIQTAIERTNKLKESVDNTIKSIDTRFAAAQTDINKVTEAVNAFDTALKNPQQNADRLVGALVNLGRQASLATLVAPTDASFKSFDTLFNRFNETETGASRVQEKVSLLQNSIKNLFIANQQYGIRGAALFDLNNLVEGNNLLDFAKERIRTLGTQNNLSDVLNQLRFIKETLDQTGQGGVFGERIGVLTKFAEEVNGYQKEITQLGEKNKQYEETVSRLANRVAVLTKLQGEFVEARKAGESTSQLERAILANVLSYQRELTAVNLKQKEVTASADALVAKQSEFGVSKALTSLRGGLEGAEQRIKSTTTDFGNLGTAANEAEKQIYNAFKVLLSGGANVKVGGLKTLEDSLSKQGLDITKSVSNVLAKIEQEINSNKVSLAPLVKSLERDIGNVRASLELGLINEVPKLITTLVANINSGFNQLSSVEQTSTLGPLKIILKDLESGLSKLSEATTTNLTVVKKSFSEAFSSKTTDAEAFKNNVTELANAVTQVKETASNLSKSFDTKTAQEQFAALTTKAQDLILVLKNLNEKRSAKSFNKADFIEQETQIKNVTNALKNLLNSDKTVGSDKYFLKKVLNQLTIQSEEFNKKFGTNVVSGIRDSIDTFKAKFREIVPVAGLTATEAGQLFDKSLNRELQGITLSGISKVSTDIRKAISAAGNDNFLVAELKNLQKEWDDYARKVVDSYQIIKAAQRSGAQFNDPNSGISTTLATTKTAIENLIKQEQDIKKDIVKWMEDPDRTLVGGTQLRERVDALRSAYKLLGTDLGNISSEAKSAEASLKELGRVGPNANVAPLKATLQGAVDSAKDLAKQKEYLDQRIGGNFESDLKTITANLVKSGNSLAVFQQVSQDFKNADYFGKSAYDLQQLYNTIEKTRTSLSSAKTGLEGRRVGIDPAIRQELDKQIVKIDEAINSLTAYNKVLGQIKSSATVAPFERLQTVFNEITKGNIPSLQIFGDFENQFRAFQVQITEATNLSSSLKKEFIDIFNSSKKGILENIDDLKIWLRVLESMQAAGQTRFTNPLTGTSTSVSTLIYNVEQLITKFSGLESSAINASTILKDRLNTTLGQLQLKAEEAGIKFSELQVRLNAVSSAGAFTGTYDKLRDLLDLLKKPIEQTTLFAAPKESYSQITQELKAYRQELVATVTWMDRYVQAASKDSNINKTKEYQDQVTQLERARNLLHEVDQAQQQLQAHASRATEFSALKGSLGGVSTNLHELYEEGALLSKGMAKLFQFMGKTLPVPKMDLSGVDTQINGVINRLGLAGTAATDFRKSIHDAFNQKFASGATLESVSRYQQAFAELEKQLVRFRSGMIQWTMGVQMFGQAMEEPFKKAVQGFIDFSDRMGIVRAVSNATTEQFNQLNEAAILMGATTRFFSEQAAEGLEKLARAGFTVEQQLAVLPSTMRLAQAAATDLATAAEITTTIMNEFRMDPAQFSEAADVIALAANATNASVQDLGYSFKYVGALAANIGADFSDLAANIALMHNSGLKGTMAGTALRGILQALFNPTKDEAKLMEDLSQRIGGLGLTISDSNGKFVGFSSILKQLESAGITTGEVLRLFGQRAGPGMAALLAMGSEKVKALEEDLKNAAGTSAKMAEVMENTLKGRVLLMQSAFKALSEQVGHNLEPALKFLSNTLADVTNKFVALRAEFPSLSAVADNLLGLVAVLAATLGGMAVTFSMIIVPTVQFVGFLKTLAVTTLVAAGAMSFYTRSARSSALAEQLFMQAVSRSTFQRKLNAAATAEQSAAIIAQTRLLAENTAAQIINTGTAAGNSTGKMAGFLNILKSIVSFKGLGAIAKFLTMNPYGLLISAATTIGVLTLTHKKSVEQTNVELQKQNEIIEYGRKEIEILGNKIINTSDNLTRLVAKQKELQTGDKEGAFKLDIALDSDKAKLQAQLKELFVRLTDESSKFKGAFVPDIQFDAKGNFSKFQVEVVNSKESIDLLNGGMKRFIEVSNGVADGLSRINSETKLLASIDKSLMSGRGFFDWLPGKFSTLFPMQTTIAGINEQLKNTKVRLNLLADAKQKLQEGKEIPVNESTFAFQTGVWRARGLQNDVAGVVKEIDAVYAEERQKLAILQQKREDAYKNLFEGFSTAFQELSADSRKKLIAAAGKTGTIFDRSSLEDPLDKELKAFIVEFLRKKGVATEEFDAAVVEMTARFKESFIKAAREISGTKVLGDALKDPFNAFANNMKSVETLLEQSSKDLKAKLDEQKKLLDRFKSVIDEVKKYQDAVAEQIKTRFEVKSAKIDFELDVDKTKVERQYDTAIKDLERESKVVQFSIPFELNAGTFDPAKFESIKNVHTTLLTYEDEFNQALVDAQVKRVSDSLAVERDALAQRKDALDAKLKEFATLYGEDANQFLSVENVKTLDYLKELQARGQEYQKYLKSEYDLTKNSIKELMGLQEQLRNNQKKLVDEQTKFNDTSLKFAKDVGMLGASEAEKWDLAVESVKAFNAQAEEAIKVGDLGKARDLSQKSQAVLQSLLSGLDNESVTKKSVDKLLTNLNLALEQADFEATLAKATAHFDKFELPDIKLAPKFEIKPTSFTTDDTVKALQTFKSVVGTEFKDLELLTGGFGEGFQYGLNRVDGNIRATGSGIIQVLRNTKNQVAASDQSFKEFFKYDRGELGIDVWTDTSKAMGVMIDQMHQADASIRSGFVPTIQAVKTELGNVVYGFYDLNGAMTKMDLVSGTVFKPLTTQLLESKRELTGFKSLVKTEVDELTRQSKVVELPISFKVDFSKLGGYELQSMTQYGTEALSYEVTLNERLFEIRKQSAQQDLETIINTIEKKKSLVNDFLAGLVNEYTKNGKAIDELDIKSQADYKTRKNEAFNFTLKFLQEELFATQAAFDQQYSAYQELENKKKSIREKNILFQANAAKNLAAIDNVSRTDSEKAYISRQQILQNESDVEQAIAKKDYDRAQALVEQRQQLIDTMIGQLKPEDSYSKWFLRQAQTQASQDFGSISGALTQQIEEKSTSLAKVLDIYTERMNSLKDKIKTTRIEVERLVEELFKLQTLGNKEQAAKLLTLAGQAQANFTTANTGLLKNNEGDVKKIGSEIDTLTQNSQNLATALGLADNNLEDLANKGLKLKSETLAINVDDKQATADLIAFSIMAQKEFNKLNNVVVKIDVDQVIKDKLNDYQDLKKVVSDAQDYQLALKGIQDRMPAIRAITEETTKIQRNLAVGNQLSGLETSLKSVYETVDKNRGKELIEVDKEKLQKDLEEVKRQLAGLDTELAKTDLTGDERKALTDKITLLYNAKAQLDSIISDNKVDKTKLAELAGVINDAIPIIAEGGKKLGETAEQSMIAALKKLLPQSQAILLQLKNLQTKFQINPVEGGEFAKSISEASRNASQIFAQLGDKLRKALDTGEIPINDKARAPAEELLRVLNEIKNVTADEQIPLEDKLNKLAALQAQLNKANVDLNKAQAAAKKESATAATQETQAVQQTVTAEEDALNAAVKKRDAALAAADTKKPEQEKGYSQARLATAREYASLLAAVNQNAKDAQGNFTGAFGVSEKSLDQLNTLSGELVGYVTRLNEAKSKKDQAFDFLGMSADINSVIDQMLRIKDLPAGIRASLQEMQNQFNKTGNVEIKPVLTTKDAASANNVKVVKDGIEQQLKGTNAPEVTVKPKLPDNFGSELLQRIEERIPEIKLPEVPVAPKLADTFGTDLLQQWEANIPQIELPKVPVTPKLPDNSGSELSSQLAQVKNSIPEDAKNVEMTIDEAILASHWREIKARLKEDKVELQASLPDGMLVAQALKTAFQDQAAQDAAKLPILPELDPQALNVLSSGLEELKPFLPEVLFGEAGLDPATLPANAAAMLAEANTAVANQGPLTLSSAQFVPNQEEFAKINEEIESNIKSVPLNFSLGDAATKIQSLIELVGKIPTEKTMTVYVNYVAQGDIPEGQSTGGVIGKMLGGLITVQRFAAGGMAKFKALTSPVVPGSGSGDKVPAMLEPGEFVIRKAAVGRLGVDFLNVLNSGLVQFKQLGGMVYNTPINTLNKLAGMIQPSFQLPQMETVNSTPLANVSLTIQDKPFNIRMQKDQVESFVEAAKKLKRGLLK